MLVKSSQLWSTLIKLGQTHFKLVLFGTGHYRGIHSIDFSEYDDRIHIFSWDDQRPEPMVFDDGCGNDGVHELFSSQQIHARVVSAPSITPVWILASRLVTLPCYSVQIPFILTPR